MSYEIHPAAAIFPMMDDKTFQSLKADIQANGVEEMGMLFQGKILDGRNRYRACQELGIEFDWMEIEPQDAATFDPVQYVLTHNLHRRHLKQSQRAMIAAKMATLSRGRPKDNRSNELFTEDAAATLLSVSVPTLKRAKHVLDHGCKQLIEAVESTDIAVSLAEKLCKAEPDKKEQARLVKDGKQAVREFINPMPCEIQPIEIDDEAVIDLAHVGDKFDEPVVRAFKVADYRLNTIRKMLALLEFHERAVVRDWLDEAYDA